MLLAIRLCIPNNTAVGVHALASNTTASGNSAFGYQTLYTNSTGYWNTAVGYKAMYSNTTGIDNTAIGWSALILNTDGIENTASGMETLGSNVSGDGNTGDGYKALFSTSTGSNNTAVGYRALFSNTTGSTNSAFGYQSGPAAGSVNLSNSTALGSGATTTASNQVRVGNSSVTSIGGQVGWTTLSDGRFKKDIRNDVVGLAFINQLKPVSYAIDPDVFDKFVGIPDSMKIRREEIGKFRHTGFIAQDVEKIIKDSGYSFSGVDLPKNEKDPYGTRYADFVVPLVKAVQELNAKVEEQQRKIDVLLSQIDNQELKSNDADSESSTIGLRQNNPNPFTVDTEIHMVLPEATRTASIIIYNLEGSQLKSIQVNSRGNAAVKVSASELKPGMYIYALIVDGKVIDTKRMILTQ